MSEDYKRLTDRELLKAAMHALRSYQHGSSSTDLAKTMADRIDLQLKPPSGVDAVPAEMGMLRCLEYVECVYRLNCVSEDEPSSTLRYMQNVIAANSKAPVPVDLGVLVNRFLAWPLPKTLCADGCVAMSTYEFPRSGTNLLTATEAETMLRHVLGVDPTP